MLTLDLENLWAIAGGHGIRPEAWRATGVDLPKHLYTLENSGHLGFSHLLEDLDLATRIRSFTDHVPFPVKEVVVLGIGGSALGTLCIQQTLRPLFDNEKPVRPGPRLHVVDNVDPVLIGQLKSMLDFSHTLFLVVSKSGETMETLAQYFYFESRLIQKGLHPEDHFVFITDPHKGFLRSLSHRNPKWRFFDIPSDVGGRFSVLSAVGLLPAALMGLSIEKMREGARTMRQRFLSHDFDKNLPFQVAALQYLLALNGKTIHVMMPYSQRLIGFADWYRQLLAESIGKAVDRSGKTVHRGITPVSALGVTDQHSQLQLYVEGPNDKQFLFLEVADNGSEISIPNPYPDASATAFLNGVTFEKLLRTEKLATAQALTHHNRPNVTLKIPHLDETVLGQLFFLFEGATAFLGEFFNINAFDQPGVELTKVLTKEYLQP